MICRIIEPGYYSSFPLFLSKILSMKKLMISCFSVMFLSGAAYAQKVRLMDGSVDALKGVKKINIQFDYSHMGVGKFETEEGYIAKKREDYEGKEPGRGEAWEKTWKADRKNRFEPQFKDLFAKYSNITPGEYPNEKYTLIFKTTFTEPGYNVYVSRKNAEIDGEAWIVETANPNNVIAKIAVHNCPGRTSMGNDYETGNRIEESYAVAGKGLGKFLSKELR